MSSSLIKRIQLSNQQLKSYKEEGVQTIFHHKKLKPRACQKILNRFLAFAIEYPYLENSIKIQQCDFF